MDVSIIVPIYNVAPYLDACLASAAGSVGALEAEFLLVDDASEDGSAEIAAAWERKDPRFRLFRLVLDSSDIAYRRRGTPDLADFSRYPRKTRRQRNGTF